MRDREKRGRSGSPPLISPRAQDTNVSPGNAEAQRGISQFTLSKIAATRSKFLFNTEGAKAKDH